MNHDGWNRDLLKEIFSEDRCNHVLNKIGTIGYFNAWDNPWWMPQGSRKFTIKSGWTIIRQSGNVNEDLRFIWEKGIPFKVSFFFLSYERKYYLQVTF